MDKPLAVSLSPALVLVLVASVVFCPASLSTLAKVSSESCSTMTYSKMTVQSKMSPLVAESP